MRSMKGSLSAVVCVTVLCASATAWAQPTAVELFEKGRALMDKSQFAEACKLFGESNKLDPVLMGSILNLGLCNERQDNLATALVWYRKAQVNSQGPALEAATAKITELTELVPVITLNFPGGTPSNASVTMDGTVIPSSSWARIEIDRGQHSIEVAVPEKAAFRESVDLPARGRKTVEVRFASDAVTTPTPAGPQTATTRETNWKRNAFIFGGIGAALTIAAPLSAYAFCGSPGACDNKNGLRKTKIISTPLLVGGVALLGVGAYYYFVAPRQEQVNQTALVPAIGEDSVGLALSGSW
jgi:hypothetical protein